MPYPRTFRRSRHSLFCGCSNLRSIRRVTSSPRAGIAVILNYLSDPNYIDGIPDWLSVAIAPATSIAAMQICGVTHPPAGALANSVIPVENENTCTNGVLPRTACDWLAI